MQPKTKTSVFLNENDDPIDIRYDFVFKAVFTKETPESKGALSKLVSALIGKEVTITTLAANELPVNNIKDRKIRFDINCRTEEDERVNVEMTLDPKPYEPVRLEYYSSALFTGQEISGKDKTYSDLKHCYQIAILAEKTFFADEAFYHSFLNYDPDRKVSLNGKTRIITVELCKVKKIANKPVEEMNVPELWAYYFEYLSDKSKRSKIIEILEKEEGIAMATETLMKISKNELEHLRYWSDVKARLDYQSERAYEREEIEKQSELKYQGVIADLTAENARLREQLAKQATNS